MESKATVRTYEKPVLHSQKIEFGRDGVTCTVHGNRQDAG